jgi:hypothetical protein
MGQFKEYKGVRYKREKNRWLIIWPSGLRAIVDFPSEQDLKMEIDSLAGG